jgi:hypothetical protein
LSLVLGCLHLAMWGAMGLPAQGAPATASGAGKTPETSEAHSSKSRDVLEKALYSYTVGLRYRYFIEFVGRENAQTEDETGSDHQPNIGRRDYESAVGIGDGEEQVMFEIALRASPRAIETWDEIDAATLEFLNEHRPIERIAEDPKIAALIKEQYKLVADVRETLERELGKGFLKKLDAYVFREFINRKGPNSERWRGMISPDFADLETHSKEDTASNQRLLAFAEFFQDSGNILARTYEKTKDNDPGVTAWIVSCTPKEKVATVIETIRQVNHRMQENIARENAMIGVYHRKNGPAPVPESEFGDTDREFWRSVDDGIKELKGTLNDADLKKFERAVNDTFGRGLREEASGQGLQLSSR